MGPTGGDPPSRVGNRGGVCERAAKITLPRRSVTIAASTDDPERLPSAGRSLAPRRLPLAAFRFGTPPRFPGAARVHDDDAVRPTSANDTIVSTTLPKGRFLAAPADHAGAWPGSRRRIADEVPRDFRRTRERREASHRSGSRSFDVPCETPASPRERAVPVDDVPRSCERLHRRHGPRAPSRGFLE